MGLKSVKSVELFLDICGVFLFCMGVSKNRGKTPQIIHFNRVVHYKPSILGGFPLFWG